MQAVEHALMGRLGRCDGCLGGVLSADILGAELGCDGTYHILYWIWDRSDMPMPVWVGSHRLLCDSHLRSCSEQN